MSWQYYLRRREEVQQETNILYRYALYGIALVTLVTAAAGGIKGLLQNGAVLENIVTGAKAGLLIGAVAVGLPASIIGDARERAVFAAREALIGGSR